MFAYTKSEWRLKKLLQRDVFSQAREKEVPRFSLACYNKLCAMFTVKGERWMSPGLAKMFITFIAMGLMFISVLCAYFGRMKLTGIFRGILLTISFICLVLAGIITFIIVIGGPAA